MRRLMPFAVIMVTAVAVLVLLMAACGTTTDEDCDAEDLRNREDECGYYVGDTWILYPWIVSGAGGAPPSGQHPGPSHQRPPATKRPGVDRPHTQSKPVIVKPAAPSRRGK